MRLLVHLLFIDCALAGAPAGAATVPSGFTETLVAGGLSAPTAMQFAPDGRLFVCEQGGTLRVIENGALPPPNSQSLNTTLGKVLRLNPDGSIPADKTDPSIDTL